MKTIGFESRILAGVPCAVAIGVFDGIHSGHRKVLQATVDFAAENHLSSVAVSFSRNPKMAKGAMAQAKPLSSFRTVEEIMLNIGIDYHCIIDFSDEMSKLTGVEFIAELCSFCKVSALLVGKDFRCGCPEACLGTDQLGKALSDLNIDAPVVAIDPVLDDRGRVVSSSLIRSMLLKGDIAGSAVLLGRPYSLDCKGVSFASDGNVLLTEAGSFAELLPAAGTYRASAIAEDGKSYDIVLSINGSCLAFQFSEPVKIDRINFKG
ncbi:MAG: FAD synthetase family protein [Sphaerochaetaceae bacterium]|nr:FAD synthetase family protein [Sphaerochaetaceae bacterium]MDD4397360.1 FAD synthetase family protein [Sphaerochaetaceae bacterium]